MIGHLSRGGLQFAVAENFIAFHFTYSETNNNHEEADTLLIHCIRSSKLHSKRAWVCATDVDVVVLLIAHCNLLSCRNVYFGVSAEKTNINSLLEFLASERAKCLLKLHYLTGCDALGKFYNVSKELWTKLFLQIKDQDISKPFECLQKEVMPKTIDHLANLFCWGYINRAEPPNLTALAEVRVHLHKPKNDSYEKIPPKMGSFYINIFCTFHQLAIIF